MILYIIMGWVTFRCAKYTLTEVFPSLSPWDGFDRGVAVTLSIFWPIGLPIVGLMMVVAQIYGLLVRD